MEQVYALGVSCIEFVQYWFADYYTFFELVNNISDPQHVIDILFPLISIVDSVFAAQLLLCMAFGSWLNAVMKWWLLEDRPYWWVQETSFYSDLHRPILQQTLQTCETGPGSPSGHTTTASMVLLLSLMWISHIMHDKKVYLWWWKHVMYPLVAVALGSVMLARMFVATHFPHQCLLGALIGSFLAPALCIYVSDPYIWRCGANPSCDFRKARAWHVFLALASIVIAAGTYFSLLLLGWDPHGTVKLAFRWCENPEAIHFSTTPMYAVVHSTASLLGWALCVTPAVAEYRHYTKNRSLLMAASITATILYGYHYVQDTMCKDNVTRFYAMQFVLAALKPMLLLRVTPAIAMWPFSRGKNKVE